MGRMRLRRLAAAVCLLPVLATALVACGDDSGHVEVGDVVGAVRPEKLGKSPAMLMIPTGELRIRAGEPADRLTAEDTRDRTAYDAPGGATFVPITWEFDTRRFAKIARFIAATATPTVDLVVGTESYRISPPTGERDRETFYVAVDGDTTDLRLRVTFDEVEQTVDLDSGKRKPGQARDLYRLGAKPHAPESSCTRSIGFKMGDASVEHSCKLEGPVFLPYAAGRWAPKGHRLMAVELRTRLQRISEAVPRGGAWWFGSSVRTTLTAAGDRPIATITEDGDGSVCPDPTTAECRAASISVFDLTGATTPRLLLLAQAYRLEHGPAWGSYEPPKSKKAAAAGGIRLPR